MKCEPSPRHRPWLRLTAMRRPHSNFLVRFGAALVAFLLLEGVLFPSPLRACTTHAIQSPLPPFHDQPPAESAEPALIDDRPVLPAEPSPTRPPCSGLHCSEDQPPAVPPAPATGDDPCACWPASALLLEPGAGARSFPSTSAAVRRPTAIFHPPRLCATTD